MFLKSIVLFALLMASCLFVNGQAKEFDPNTLSDGGRTAYLSLKKVRLYAIGGVGYGGVISEGEKALEVLIEERNAQEGFLSLVREGTLEAGLYGLFGLRMLIASVLRMLKNTLSRFDFWKVTQRGSIWHLDAFSLRLATRKKGLCC